ncbi:MAG: PKD-like domain-containing protein, partial [Bacteroidota bacterium]
MRIFLTLGVMLLTMCCLTMQAQVNITYPNPAQDVNACNAGSSLTVRLEFTNATADNPMVSFQLPTGIAYEAGSVATGAASAGYTIAEADVSNPNQPTFTIMPTDINAGDFIEFTINRTGGCDAVDFANGGGIFKDAITVSTDAGDAMETDNAVNSYNLLAASLAISYNSMANQTTSNLPDSFTGDISLIQGGLGSVPAVRYYTIPGPGLSNYTLKYNGTALTPDATSGDTLFYDLNETAYPGVFGGDSAFNNGEQVDFEECYDVEMSCDQNQNTVTHGAYWGCSLTDICQRADEVTASVAVLASQPTLSIRNLVNNEPLCMDGASRGDQVWEIVNTSGASAIISFETQANVSFFGLGGSPEMSIDSSSTVITVDGVDITDNISTIVSTGRGACAGLSDEFVPEVRYNDVIIQPGQTILISYDYVACCPNHACNSFRQIYNPWFAYRYTDICGNSPVTGRPAPINNTYGVIQAGGTSFSGPAGIRDGQVDSYCFTFLGPGLLGNRTGANQLSVDLDLPPEFSVSGPITVSTGGTSITPTSSSPPGSAGMVNVTFEQADMTGGPLEVCFDLEFTCGVTGGYELAADLQQIVGNGTCGSACTFPINCNSNSVSAVCVAPCPEGGGDIVCSEITRTSLGLEDLDNDRQYDTDNLVDPAVARLDRASPCDTICLDTKMKIIDGSTGPTWENAQLRLQANYNYLVPISAEVEIFDNGTLVGVVSGVTPSNTTPAGIFEYDISATRLNGLDNTFPVNFLFDANDSIAMRTCLYIDPTLASNLYNYTTLGFIGGTPDCTNDLLIQSDLEMSNDNFANRYSCVPGFANMEIVSTGINTLVRSDGNTPSTRGCQQFFTYMYQRGQRGCLIRSSFDWYPNEFRPIHRPTIVSTQPYPGMTFNRMRISYVGGGGPVVITTPTSVGPTGELFFDIGSLMADEGGPIPWLEEQYQIQYDIFYDADCRFDQPNNVNVPVTLGYTDPACNIDYDRNGLANVRHTIDPQLTFAQSPVTAPASSVNTCFTLDAFNGGNSATANLNFTWLTILNPSGNISFNSVEQSGTPVPYNSTADIYELGAHTFNTTKSIDVCITPNECVRDSFQVVYAWSCTEYPSSAMELDACEFDTLTYYVEPVPSGIQLAITDEPDPNMAADLCERDTIELIVNSSLNGDVIDPAIDVLTPDGFDPFMVEVEYPIGMNIEAVPFVDTGDTVKIDLTQHSQVMNNSLPGIIANPGTDLRQMLVRFMYETNCDYDPSNAVLGFVGRGNSPCSDPARGSGVAANSNPILVNGAAPPYTASPNLTTSDADLACNENTTVNIDFTIVGGDTDGNDFAEVIVPAAISYVPSSLNCTSPIVAHCPTYMGMSTNANGDNVFTFNYPAGIPDGSNVMYSIDLAETGVASCDGFDMVLNNLTRLPSLSCMGVSCDMPINTIAGTDTLAFTVTKPILSFTNERFCSATSATDGAEYFATLNVANADVQAGETLDIGIACSSDRTAILETITVNGPITAGTSVDLMGMFGGICVSTTDSLVFSIMPTTENCICSPAEGVAAPVDDTADTNFTLAANACVGDVVTLTPDVAGGVFSGANVTDNGDGSGGVFNAASPGMYEIAYTVMNAGMVCPSETTMIIEVIEPQAFTLADVHVECNVSPNGIYDLNGLFATRSSTAEGGTWSLVTTTTDAAVVAATLDYATAGCYQVRYTPPAVANCTTPPADAFICISEQPQPNFNIQNEVCLSAGDAAQTFTPTLNSPNYNGTPTRAWTIDDTNLTNASATIDAATGVVTLTPDATAGPVSGTYTVALMETISYAACGTNPAGMCTESFSVVVSVQDGTSLDASFTTPVAVCVNTAVPLTPTTNGGVFTGDNVVDNGNGTGGTFESSTPGVYSVTYTLSSANGCTNTYTRSIEVIEPQSFTLTDAQLQCVADATGAFDLNGLLSNVSPSAAGGTWTSFNFLAPVAGSTMQYITPGCYEVQYTPPATVMGCAAAPASAFVYITERPDPEFAYQDQICISEGSSTQTYTPSFITSSFGSRVWMIDASNLNNATATIDMNTGTVSLTPTGGIVSGYYEVSLTETVSYMACNDFMAQDCSATSTVRVNVQDGTALDASFTASPSPVCLGETVTLTPSTNGGVFSGTGVTDSGNGTGATFTASMPGSYTVIYTLNSTSGCTNTFAATVEVVAPQAFTLTDAAIRCAINPSGIYDLNGLFTSISPTAQGGTWSLVSGAGAAVQGATLGYSAAGCYEVQYTPPATTIANCGATPQTAFVQISEQPQPSFDIQNAVCLSAGDAAQMFTPSVNSPTYDAAATAAWSIDATNLTNAIASIDAGTGVVTLTPDATAGPIGGSYEVTLTETITYAACGTALPAGMCTESFSVVVSVQDGTSLDASFLLGDQACTNVGVTFSPAVTGGVFTGENVTDNGDGTGATFTASTPGVYAVTYTLSSANGCTNTYTQNIEVIEPQAFTLNDAYIECVIDPAGFYDLNALLASANSSAAGGTWTLISTGTTASVVGNSLQYNTAGCYEVQYTPPTTVSTCEAAAANAFVYISAQPQASFDIADTGCWDGTAGSLTITPTVTSPDYAGTPTVNTNWTLGTNGTTTTSTVDATTGIVTINDGGSVEVCYTETIVNPTCNGVADPVCTQTTCRVINITNTPNAVDPTWTSVGPFCIDNTTAIDLDAQVTGTAGGVFTGAGVTALANNNYSFTPSAAGAGTHAICYTVGSGAGCDAVLCRNIEVAPAVSADATLQDVHVACAIRPSGNVSLSSLFTASTSTGGTFSAGTQFDANAQIVGNTLNYTGPGCYEIMYSVTNTSFAGATGACAASASSSAFVYISEQPQPSFVVSESVVCWDGAAGSATITPSITSPAYTATVMRTWSLGTNGTTTTSTVDATTGVVTINDAGSVELCFTETTTNPSCNGVADPVCTETVCQIINVTETSDVVDADWTAIGPFCMDDTTPIDLGSLVTGTPNGGFLGSAGVVETEITPGVNTYTFTPSLAGAGTHSICYTVVTSAGCSETLCQTVEVFPTVTADASLQDVHVACAINPSGNISLDALFTATTDAGGTFSAGTQFDANAQIAGNTLNYTGPGCYEIQYTVTNSSFAGAVGGCTASDTQTAFILVTEQPQPSFDIQNEVCLSAGDAAQTFTPNVSSPTYTSAATTAWAIDATALVGATATVDASTGEVTLTATGGNVSGSYTLTLTETIAYAACGTTPAGTCTESFPVTVEVRDGTALDASFTTVPNAVCVNETVTLTPTTPGGIFTGTGVTDDGAGTGGTFTATTAGVYVVTYVLTDPNGCTSASSINIEVIGTQAFALTDAEVECSISSSGIFDLNALFTNIEDEAVGGTWSVVGTGAAAIAPNSSLLQYNQSGCYELTYTPPSTVTACDAAPQTTFVYVSQQPRPSFDLIDEYCWDGVTNPSIPELLNSPTVDYTYNGTAQAVEYLWTTSDATVVSITPGTETTNNAGLVVQGIGFVEICLTETLPNGTGCGSMSARPCSAQYCEFVTITSAAQGVSSAWTDFGPICSNASGGSAATPVDLDDLVTGTPNGVFTGVGVTLDGAHPNYIFDPTGLGGQTITICYSVGTGTGGCDGDQCHEIVVLEAVDATLNTVQVCEPVNGTSSLDLETLFIATTTAGGTFSIVNTTGTATGTILRENLTYSGSGTIEIAYSVGNASSCDAPVGTGVDCTSATVDGDCFGTGTATITINPAPTGSDATLPTVCSDMQYMIDIATVAGVSTASTYTWTAFYQAGLIGGDSGVTGDSNQSGSSTGTGTTITEILTNLTNRELFVVYTITPNSADGCPGTPFTITQPIGPEPVPVSSVEAAVCSDEAFQLDLDKFNIINNLETMYEWELMYDDGAGNMTMLSGQMTNQFIDLSLTNESNDVVNAMFVIMPSSSNTPSCADGMFMVVVPILPEPTASDVTAPTVCSEESYELEAQAYITNGVFSFFTWTAVYEAGLTGGETQGSSGYITETLVNTTNNTLNAVYTITPTSLDGCAGTPFEVTVPVAPTPTGADSVEAPVCSGTALNIDPQGNITNGVSSSFEWTAFYHAGLTGGTGNGTGIITETLVNTTPYTLNAIYTITPLSNPGSCEGETFTITQPIHPAPLVTGIAVNIENICIQDAVATVNITGATSLADGFYDVNYTVNSGAVQTVNIYFAGGEASFPITGLPLGTYTVEIVNLTNTFACTTNVNLEANFCVSGCTIVSTPCACNEDQSANGAQDGTFTETVSIENTTPAEIWTVNAVATAQGGTTQPVGIFFGDVLTYNAGTNSHDLSFTHTDDSGYMVQIEGPNAPGSINNRTLTLSNVCAYPEVIWETEVDLTCAGEDFGGTVELQDEYCGDAAPVDLTLIEVDGNPSDSIFFQIDDLSTIANPDYTNVTTLNPATLPVGNYVLKGIFDGQFVDATNGTVANPAFPGCMTMLTHEFEVNTPAGFACNDNVNLSVNDSCYAVITPELMLNNSCEGSLYYVEVSQTIQQYVLPGSTPFQILLDASSIACGTSIDVQVFSCTTGESCWGSVLIEDKQPPVLECIGGEFDYCEVGAVAPSIICEAIIPCYL